jgi:hypothetical protein
MGNQSDRMAGEGLSHKARTLAELERAAAERGIRLGEWIRDVLFRELRGGATTATHE